MRSPIYRPGDIAPAQAPYAVVDRWGKCVSWEEMEKGQPFPPLSGATHERVYVRLDDVALDRLR